MYHIEAHKPYSNIPPLSVWCKLNPGASESLPVHLEQGVFLLTLHQNAGAGFQNSFSPETHKKGAGFEGVGCNVLYTRGIQGRNPKQQ